MIWRFLFLYKIKCLCRFSHNFSLGLHNSLNMYCIIKLFIKEVLLNLLPNIAPRKVFVKPWRRWRQCCRTGKYNTIPSFPQICTGTDKSLLNCVPCMLWTSSHTNVPCLLMCSRVYVPYVLTSSHAYMSCVLTCSHASVPCMLTCSRASVPCMLMCLRVLPAYVLMCLRALRAYALT